MVMRRGVSVKPLPGAGRFQTQHLSLPHQQVKVAVHSPKAYARQAGFGHGIQFIRRGMGLHPAQFF
jgi:hypothetical protein